MMVHANRNNSTVWFDIKELCWAAYFRLFMIQKCLEMLDGISEETRPLAIGDVTPGHEYVGYEGTRRVHPARDRVHWRFVGYGDDASLSANVKNFLNSLPVIFIMALFHRVTLQTSSVVHFTLVIPNNTVHLTHVKYPLSYGVPVRERYGSTLLPATREQHDQNCTQSH